MNADAMCMPQMGINYYQFKDKKFLSKSTLQAKNNREISHVRKQNISFLDFLSCEIETFLFYKRSLFIV